MSHPRIAQTSTGETGILFVRLADERRKCFNFSGFLFEWKTSV